MQNFHQAWKAYQFSQGTIPARKREICGYRYIYIRNDQFSEQVLSALTHQTTEPGRVHQENFKKMEISDMKALPYFNANAETTLQTDASKKRPRASLTQKGKDIPVTDTFITDTLSQATPMNPEDDIQLPIRKANMITIRILTHTSTHILMSVQPQDSLSNKLNRLRKSTTQGNQLTRLSHYINTEFQCDKKSLPTDLHKCWNHRETLSIKSRTTIMINNIMNTIPMILMSEHPSESISNRLAWPGKHTSQKKHITRLKDDEVCDKKISDDLVYPTKDTSSASILSELEEREQITEDIPAPADIAAPAPADTLETVEEQPTLQDQESQWGSQYI